MKRIEELASEFRFFAGNPGAAIERHRQKTGLGAIGVLYLYAPEEIIHASGFLPVGMWGGNKEISRARAHLAPFACSIMQAVVELQQLGVYDCLDAVVISVPCDTLKSVSQIWNGKAQPVIFTHPQNRKLEAANDFLAEEYRIVRDKLEKIIGVKITDEAIEKSIEIYNENRRAMRDFCDAAADYPEIITPSLRHAVIKARFFMEKAQHTALVKELALELRKKARTPWTGKKVVLTGIMAEPNGFLDILQENRLAVVADDLAQESRQFRHDVPPGRDPFMRLARWWQNLEGCALAMDIKKRRGQMLIDLANSSGADGVIVCMMKFCDPEEFDYPIFYPELKKAGVKSTMIEIDLEGNSFEQARTRIQTFSESII